MNSGFRGRGVMLVSVFALFRIAQLGLRIVQLGFVSLVMSEMILFQ